MDSLNVNTMRFVIDVSTVLLFGLMWLGITAFLRLKKSKSFVYLIFFTIFYVYLFKVLDYTLFQFQSLLILNYLKPGVLMLQGGTMEESLNLIPLITLTPDDVKTSLLNILLMIPFGFGLPFITNLRIKKIIFSGALFSIAIELLQFISGFIAGITFRVTDINDVLFNTIGVAIGYLLFIGFIRIYLRIFHKWQTSTNPIVHYINERPQIDTTTH
jgi:glycopeptide antibiotics resistance protein